MMKDRVKASYIACFLHDRVTAVRKRLFYRGKRFRAGSLGGIPVVTSEEGNRRLREMLLGGKPFAAVRYGGTEMHSYLAGKAYLLGLKKEIPQIVLDTMQRQSGFFPNSVEIFPRYIDLMEKTSGDIDLLATYGWKMEDFMVKNYMKSDVCISDNRALEPYYFQHHDPWSKALEGKRVLVIHPFAESIERQYQIRGKLFDDPDILPEFELHTLKAVQTICGTKDERFDTWFDALDYMYQEAMKIPFDVAILGCGAYGQPLACMLKRAGKQAIHIGGATQILFGIRGKRWELNSKEISALFNENWIRPTAEETPANKAANEFGGAYW